MNTPNDGGLSCVKRIPQACILVHAFSRSREAILFGIGHDVACGLVPASPASHTVPGAAHRGASPDALRA